MSGASRLGRAAKLGILCSVKIAHPCNSLAAKISERTDIPRMRAGFSSPHRPPIGIRHSISKHRNIPILARLSSPCISFPRHLIVSLASGRSLVSLQFGNIASEPACGDVIQGTRSVFSGHGRREGVVSEHLFVLCDHPKSMTVRGMRWQAVAPSVSCALLALALPSWPYPEDCACGEGAVFGSLTLGPPLVCRILVHKTMAPRPAAILGSN